MYILRKSVAAVIRLQMGQSLVVPRHLSQHNRQHVCQQPVEAVGSLYGSRHIRHRTAGARQDSFLCHFSFQQGQNPQ